MYNYIANYKKTNNIYVDMLLLTWSYKSSYRLKEWLYCGYTHEQFKKARIGLINQGLLQRNFALSKHVKNTCKNLYGSKKTDYLLCLVNSINPLKESL